jgi:hypothetical protein
VREIDTFSRNRTHHAVNLAKQQGIFQRAYRRKIESADFTDEIMEKIVALVGRAVSSRRITASHGLAQNQIAVAFVVRDNGREIQKAQPLEKIVSAARDFTLRQGAHTKHSNVAVAFGNGFKLGKSYAGSRKQPATKSRRLCNYHIRNVALGLFTSGPWVISR